MRTKKITLSPFSRALLIEALCIRPENERELITYLQGNPSKQLLARGAGLSYSDCDLTQEGLHIDMKRFNHFISFDQDTGIVVCQAGVTFNDLLGLDEHFIPPVLPGTLHATLAGGIANDIHGKNNPQEKSLGHHLIWIDILVNGTVIRCSREEHSDLFYATIGGLGLTGVILKAALRLKKAPHGVQVEHQPFHSLDLLLQQMLLNEHSSNYQVAWLDLLYSCPRGILSVAHHSDSYPTRKTVVHRVPKQPFGLINQWSMKAFNSCYFHHQKGKNILSLVEFNNPLDKIAHWNYLYGKKGLLQFQAVFPKEKALAIIEQLLILIKKHQATPTLSVLKNFSHSGEGLLSFCTPGFTIAIDFVNNQQAKAAIAAMNQLSADTQGRVYLAKDLLLSPQQYESMYEHHRLFSKVLSDYQSPMHSDLAKRLGIIK